MLICPQCQFENPNTNKFCQRCGTSLTHKTCDECSTQVPVNAETCHNCGAFTGTVWWAIISKELENLATPTGSQEASPKLSELVASDAAQVEVSQAPLSGDSNTREVSSTTTVGSSVASIPPSVAEDGMKADASQESAATSSEESIAVDDTVTQALLSSGRSSVTESVSEKNDGDGVSSPTSTVVYLDPQQRYRLLEPQSLQQLAPSEATPYEASVRVLDCQPYQKSLLEALRDQQQGNAQKLEPPTSQSSSIPSDSGKVLGIPAIAQPYLALNELYYPTVPEVHDAWQQDGEAVVLLEDRSKWQLLRDLWGSEQLSTLQILYWLDEMAKLWEALEPWNYRQSLLETSNLRVDEDQALGLMRLYPEPQEPKLTLQDLGHMWQTLFDQSQRTQFVSLGAVFRQLCTNEIATIKELRSQLEEIAREHQPSELIGESSTQTPYSTMDMTINPIEGTEAPPATVIQKAPINEVSPSPENDEIPTQILPMQLLSLDDAGCTHVGHQREHNEDCYGIQTQLKKHENPMGRAVQARGLYIICDGMGGHAGGEVASAMAVERLKRYFQENWQDHLPTEESVREGVRLANQTIYDVNQQNARSGSGRMGTTLAMILIQNTEAAIAHVGDSRIYCLTRKRGLEQITADHEVGQREINRGVPREIAYARPDAYQLTQALGPRNEQFVNPDVQFLELNEDTLFLICSDGLSDNDLVETHWQTHLNPLLSSRADLDQGIIQLIDLANEHNGHDNITAILIRVKVRPNFDQQQLV
jgi:protein phosphatase